MKTSNALNLHQMILIDLAENWRTNVDPMTFLVEWVYGENSGVLNLYQYVQLLEDVFNAEKTRNQAMKIILK